MQRCVCLDETFDVAQCGNYVLLAQASVEGFALVVLEKVRRRFVAFAWYPVRVASPEDWSGAVDGLREEVPWVQNSFSKVVLGYRGVRFTAVPTKFFTAERAKQLLSTAGPVGDLDEVHYCEPLGDVTMVYTLPAQLTYAWRMLHDDSLFIHSDAAALRAAASGKGKDAQLLLVSQDNFFTQIVVQGERLLSMLPLEAFTAEDLLYFCTAAVAALPGEGGATDLTVRMVGDGVAWPDGVQSVQTRQLRTEDVKTLLRRYYKVSDEPLVPAGYEYSYTVERFREGAPLIFLLAECVS